MNAKLETARIQAARANDRISVLQSRQYSATPLQLAEIRREMAICRAIVKAYSALQSIEIRKEELRLQAEVWAQAQTFATREALAIHGK